MIQTVIGRAVIDPNLESYEAFFDGGWSRRTFEAVESSSIADAVNALVVSWRSTSAAHVLPGLMAKSLGAFAIGEVEGSAGFRASYMGRIVNGVTTTLLAEMNCHLNYNQRAALKRAVKRIESDAHRATELARNEAESFASDHWRSMVRDPQFQLFILGLQRANYNALYFAYEDFLANAVRVKDPAYSSKKSPMRDALKTHFGESIADFCWNDEEVELPRLVRNALVHNGGRRGKDLDKYATRFACATHAENPLLEGKHFCLLEDVIQIVPDNTKHLFVALKERVTSVVDNLTPSITPPTPAAP